MGRVVTVQLKCPGCEKTVRLRPGGSGREACPGCARKLPLTQTPALRERGVLERCAGCGEHRLFRQKDFNRKIGLAIVLGSAAVSLALLPFSPLSAYGVLFALTLVDLGMYWRLPEVVICYRCRAQHRGCAPESPVKGFDLLTAELVDHQARQERDT